MSELIGEKDKRKALLKQLMGRLHAGESPEAIRPRLVEVLGRVPYDEVVAVEQELIAEGLSPKAVLDLCDAHHAAMRGALDEVPELGAPAGHPAHTFAKENEALGWELNELTRLYGELADLADDDDPTDLLHAIRGRFNNLMDVEKHYLRKEFLLFPFLEQKGITGPPTVMWGKHDQTRALLKTAQEALAGVASSEPSVADLQGLAAVTLKPAADAIQSMIDKETQILLPMCMNALDDAAWYEIAKGTDEYGTCLYAPEETWRPEGAIEPEATGAVDGLVRLSTGSFTPKQLEAVLSNIPFDITFVDQDDTVRYFSHGRERIFARSKAILGRKVQYCHPPSSVDTVERILKDFKSGAQDRASFWIEMGGALHLDRVLRAPRGRRHLPGHPGGLAGPDGEARPRG